MFNKRRLWLYLCGAGVSMMLIGAAALSGCSKADDDGSVGTVQLSGTVAQGAVEGAMVFADHAAGAEANGRMDAGEAASSATTDASGGFSINKPDYDYVVVSMGGTDTITHYPAMLMRAPAGAANVSPFTTMVADDPQTRDAIESLGISYDADLSTGITPAAAFVVMSVQMAVTAVTDVLNPNGTTLPTSQVNAIQAELVARIAAQIRGRSAADLTTSATLATSLQTAIESALTGSTIGSMTNITINNPMAIAAAISPAVTTIANALIATMGSDAFSTTTLAAENSIITPAIADACDTATDAAVANAVANGGVTVTSPPNSAPMIGGTPGTSVPAGEAYSFTPSAGDVENDILVFSIVNKPSWASFNRATGALTGTPSEAGVTTGIVISVSDGLHTVSLPAFTLTVGGPPTGGTGGTL